ncbi:GNAT family N-acetyltransferase [Lactococcus garvieae]|jgi:ElaA protein|uniref:GNAT family N-acetyltransferase n=1 Tax=Lactococcus garvieae TaxID=1363 RepID=UPI000266D5F5|nr:GNAT family N-acetyltransferase [Lactococcus garvieae]MDN5628016.1 GNAT family N-acetyltransferase [Lactococcus sp.]EIT66454.1 Acetyltransferase [Lactococcus garvieae IPLA 31405]MBS4464435.1 GNAT family N-acetyltransferase [Lactococcus garvieae]MCO7128978.1 GNAT family N-acetyltransferase [Lactococcus garvieae]MDB7635251.1 GNAT family N-acetyltransferase [Lactococcus garvieae]
MEWKIKNFEELTRSELYKILHVRSEVFVVEQACAYQDIDGKDQKSLHLWLEDEEGAIQSYCRILPAGLSYPEASIGRVLVKESQRGKGTARKMMQQALEFLAQAWREPLVRIEAQYYLRAFYASFGFKEDSEPFLEDGIKHVEMILDSKDFAS